ncbi:MAG: serine hydrolase [bacterium]|nr:serine hydrolase [bacterium]
MRSIFAIIFFVFVILLIGRNLAFLPKFNLNIDKKTEATDLKNKIKEILKKQKGTYGVYYADLNSEESFGIDENQMHTAASINKLPIITALYYLADKKYLNLDDNITLQKEDIQDYGTGSLRYEKPGSIYSLRTLAKLSLKQSDNTAAYIIASKIGVENIQKLVYSWGLSQTDMANNKTTVYDMYLLLKKIYKREITNDASAKELLGFLTETDAEDRLSQIIKNAKVYHKTGDAVGNIHDVGIIEKDGIVFYVGVMTSDIADKETETKKAISEIAKEILDYKINQKY